MAPHTLPVFSADVVKTWSPFSMWNLKIVISEYFFNLDGTLSFCPKTYFEIAVFSEKALISSNSILWWEREKKIYQESYIQLWISFCLFFSSKVLQLHLVAVIWWLSFWQEKKRQSISAVIAASPSHHCSPHGVGVSWVKAQVVLAPVSNSRTPWLPSLTLSHSCLSRRLSTECFINMGSSFFSLLQALDWLSSPTHKWSHSYPCPHSGPSSSSLCWWCWAWTVRWDNPGSKQGEVQRYFRMWWWFSLLHLGSVMSS